MEEYKRKQSKLSEMFESLMNQLISNQECLEIEFNNPKCEKLKCYLKGLTLNLGIITIYFQENSIWKQEYFEKYQACYSTDFILPKTMNTFPYQNQTISENVNSDNPVLQRFFSDMLILNKENDNPNNNNSNNKNKWFNDTNPNDSSRPSLLSIPTMNQAAIDMDNKLAHFQMAMFGKEIINTTPTKANVTQSMKLEDLSQVNDVGIDGENNVNNVNDDSDILNSSFDIGGDNNDSDEEKFNQLCQRFKSLYDEFVTLKDKDVFLFIDRYLNKLIEMSKLSFFCLH